MKVLKSPEPSIYADSSRESGIPRKNCLSMKMYRPFLNARPVTERISKGQKVLIRFTPSGCSNTLMVARMLSIHSIPTDAPPLRKEIIPITSKYVNLRDMEAWRVL